MARPSNDHAAQERAASPSGVQIDWTPERGAPRAPSQDNVVRAAASVTRVDHLSLMRGGIAQFGVE